jgi:hypothetical protein
MENKCHILLWLCVVSACSTLMRCRLFVCVQDTQTAEPCREFYTQPQSDHHHGSDFEAWVSPYVDQGQTAFALAALIELVTSSGA